MPASIASEAAMAISLVDSHCHIVFRNFDGDLDEVAQRWRQAGVKTLVHACVEPSEIPAIRALADRFPEMRYSVGVHPLDTGHWQADTQQVLREAAKADDRVVAIGELGLDLFRDKNLDEQLAVLGPQLDLAMELDLPVIVGGCATTSGALHLMRAGAAGVLVGFGGGAAHTTRQTLADTRPSPGPATPGDTPPRAFQPLPSAAGTSSPARPPPPPAQTAPPRPTQTVAASARWADSTTQPAPARATPSHSQVSLPARSQTA